MSREKDSFNTRIYNVLMIIKNDTRIPVGLLNLLSYNTIRYSPRIKLIILTDVEKPFYLKKLHSLISSNNRSTLMILHRNLTIDDFIKTLRESAGEPYDVFIDYRLKKFIEVAEKLGFKPRLLYKENVAKKVM